MPSSRRALGFHSTTDDALAGLDLSGRVALVTGASGGIGAETARALAAHGATVTLACRDTVRGEAVAARIREATAGATVHVEALDLLDLASVRACAARVLARGGPLHVLINNAGVMACPLARSPDGWELQFATNHMGHFLLTSLLRPALYAETPARVVCVSSAGHMRAAVDFDDQGGLYLEDCGVSAPAGTAGVTTGYLPHAVDPEAAARLWRVSEDLLGERCA